jgi:hypothetical protein
LSRNKRALLRAHGAFDDKAETESCELADFHNTDGMSSRFEVRIAPREEPGARVYATDEGQKAQSVRATAAIQRPTIRSARRVQNNYGTSPGSRSSRRGKVTKDTMGARLAQVELPVG